MKKYIAFFILIGVILCTVLTFSVINVQKGKQLEFSESGYILSGTSDRYYFSENEKYTTSYDNQIVFNDTEGTKVTLNNDNFIHYTSGNITSLQGGVLLDLSKINDNPIVYYNVPANKEIKKISTRYTVQNLKEDVSFSEGIWKISANKYLILANNMKVTLSNGNTKDVEGFVEVEYSDNEVVKIYNQEFSYQTISSDSFIELGDGVKLNLGTKIISVNGENKMTLENMVIDSNDNVTLIDMDEEENKEDTNTESNTEANNTTGGSTSSTTTTNNNGSTTVVGGNGTTGSSGNNEIMFNVEPMNIVYEFVSNTETKVDETVTQKEPEVRLDNMEISAVGVKGTIQIKDEEDLLSKNDNITVKILNNATGKVVYLEEESYGTFSIPLDVQTLTPDTSYSVIVNATYTLNDNIYNKNFLYKTFVTGSMGIEISKAYYTANSMTFNLNFKDENVESAILYLLDKDGNEIINQNRTVQNSGGIEEIEFTGLTSNTDYIVKVANVKYNGALQDGESWQILYNCKTLKEKASIDELSFSINKRDGIFTLNIDKITDKDNAIQSYNYYVFLYDRILNDEGAYETTYDVKNPVYQEQTTEKSVQVPVGNSDDSKIVREKNYGFKVVATTYDNEKYVDIESTITGVFSLTGKKFPTVRFTKITNNNYDTTEIKGVLDIIDNENTVVVDKNNPLIVNYYSDVIQTTELVKITSLGMYTDGEGTQYGKTTDQDGNTVIRISVDLGREGNDFNGLKTATTYTFSVYGTVDLQDEMSEDGGYKNAYIGSSMVTTNTYTPIIANLSVPENAPSQNAFTVDLKLSSDSIASRESLTSLDVKVYEGSGDINTGDTQSFSKTITNLNYDQLKNNVVKDENATEVTSLQSLLFDNTLRIRPSLIGGGYEKDYQQAWYQVVVTATIDGTQYNNKIPIQAPVDNTNENVGNTTYTNDGTKETYSATYILVKGVGSKNGEPTDAQRPKATLITNAQAPNYKIEKDDNLLDNTGVAIRVSTPLVNTGTLDITSITYYVWDSKGNPIYEVDETTGKPKIDPETGENIQLQQTLPVTNQEKMPAWTVPIQYGTTETVEKDNETGKLYRGNAYQFSFTLTYDNGDVWPISESTDSVTYTKASMMTAQVSYVDKQEPIFVMYPLNSTDSEVTYRYSCKDVDAALQYPENSNREETYLTLLINSYIQQSDIGVEPDGKNHEITITIPEKDVTYALTYNKNVNKVKSSVYQTVTMTSQKFEGVIDGNSIGVESVEYDNDVLPNSIQIKFAGNYVERLAAIKASFKLSDSEEVMTSKLINVYTSNGYYANVDLLELATNNSNFDKFIGKSAELSIQYYYDDGVIGFEPVNGYQYSAYTDTKGTYYKYEKGKFDKATNIYGNIFKYEFSANEADARLKITTVSEINNNKEGTAVSLLYSEAGLKQDDNILVQREIASTESKGTGRKIRIDSLRAGIKMNNVDTSITKADLSVKLYKPASLNITGGITVEMWHSKNKDEEPNWESSKVITKVFQLSDFNSDLVIDNLSPAEYYHIRFKYTDGGREVYTYDIDTKEVGKVYTFETLATIGISNITVDYQAVSYQEKYFDINYKVTQARSNMYEFTKYSFVDKDGAVVKLTEDNIKNLNKNANYSIDDDGNLIVTNPNYNTEVQFSSIEEKVSIKPSINKFKMGENYTLKITPMVTYEGRKVELDTESFEFTAKTLNDPKIGLSMKREQYAEQGTNANKDYIKILVTISDKDALIYGNNYGQYQIKVYRYTGTTPSYSEQNRVAIYDAPYGGNAVTDNTFDIQTQATNFAIYVQNIDVNYRQYGYVAVIEMKYDRENNSKLEDHKESYKMDKIDNDEDVALGSIIIVQDKGKCTMRFYDSYYNIEKINKMKYTLYNLSNMQTQNGEFAPVWERKEDLVNQVVYYETVLPAVFYTDGTYTITMNMYVGNTLVGTIQNTAYMYGNQE